jgi:hypothetical protein
MQVWWVYEFCLPLGVSDLAMFGFSLLIFAVVALMQLAHTVTTMTRASKQDDEIEQLAVKFSHKK